jgi:hypothetical protein
VKLASWFLAVSAVTLLSCKDGTGGQDQPIDHLLIRLAPERPFYPVHDTVRAIMTAVDANGDQVPSGIGTWRSLDPTLVTVDGHGLIRAVGHGLATVEVKFEGFSAQVQVLAKGLLHFAPIQVSETWIVADTPHVVLGLLPVGHLSNPVGTAVLTIERGPRVLFRPGSGLLFGDIYAGRLVIPPGATAMRLEGDSAGNATWVGLSFRGPDLSELRDVEFRDCGAATVFMPSFGCMTSSSDGLQQGPALLLEDVTFTAPSYAAMTLGNFTTFAPGSRNLTVTDGDGHIATLSPELAGHLPPGSQFARNAENAIWIGTGLVRDSLTWPDPGVPWRLVGQVTVEGPNRPVLTIAPGVLIRGDPNSDIVTGRNTQSGLVIGDPLGPPVLIEASVTTWGGIELSDGTIPSSFANVELRQCGGTPPGAGPQACVGLFGGAGNGTRLHVENVTIRDAAYTGFNLTALARFDSTSANLTIIGSGDVPIVLPADAIASLPDGDYRFNGVDGIRIGNNSGVSESATWPNLSIPYLLPGGLVVGGGNDPVLTLEPGVVLEMGVSTRLDIGGALVAIGTVAEPIIFHSATAGVAGSWVGLELGLTADNRTKLDHVEIRDAGAGQFGTDGAVRFQYDPGGVLRNTTIVGSPSCGIMLFSGNWFEDYTNPAFGNSFVGIAGPVRCKLP